MPTERHLLHLFLILVEKIFPCISFFYQTDCRQNGKTMPENALIKRCMKRFSAFLDEPSSGTLKTKYYLYVDGRVKK